MSRPPRLSGFSYTGKYTYFVTICTLDRTPALLEDALARLVVAQIRRTAHCFRFAVLAYCVMPDHLHLLLEGLSPASDLRRCAKQLKQSTGQSYSARARRRLWQEGYYDHVLRPEEAEAVVPRSIIQNPVRAGLVKDAREYPYLGSDRWSLDTILDALL